MKKSFWFLLATVLVALLAAGCAKEYDDSELWGKISDLDQRLTELEKTVKTLNEKTVPGIQTIIDALLAQDPVVGVSQVDDSFLITFYSGKTASVPAPKGEQGDSPVMGIQLVDGVYCWTVNGELIKDASGKPVPVNGEPGKSPVFRTNDGKLEYSIDGENWTPVPEAGTPAAIVTIDETDESVIVTSGSTVIVLTKDIPFSLNFIIPDGISLMKGESAYVGYTLKGVKADDITEVGILTSAPGFDAEIEPYASQNDAGIITITNNSEIANEIHKVYIFAANGKGKTDIKGLSFSSTTLKAVMNVQLAPADASGEIILDVKADEDYNISVSDDAPWIHVTPPTRALYEDKLAVSIDANTTNAYRSGSISLISKADGETVLDEVDLLQAPSATEATSIASIAIIPDGTTITLYNVSTVAASDKKAIITDGVSQMYVLANGLYADGVFNFTGVKKTDEAGLTYLDVKSLEMKMDATPVALDKQDNYIYFLALDNDYHYVYSVINGKLGKQAGNYVVTSFDESVSFVLEDAPADLGLAALEGKDVALKAWVINAEGDLYSSVVDAIASEVKEIAFAEEPGWSIDFDGESLVSITSSLAADHYSYAVVSEEDYLSYDSADEFIHDYSYSIVDDMMFSVYYYNVVYGYDFWYVYDILFEGGNNSEQFDLDYGKFYFMVVGVDGEGAMTGQYALKQFEKVDPHVPVAYDEFIGDWEVGGNIWKISQKQAGATYSIAGTCSGDFANLEVVANYVDGKLVLPEQSFDITATGYYGAISPVNLCGQFISGRYLYMGYGELDDEPGVILTIGKLNNGSFDIMPGSSPGGGEEFTYYGTGGLYISGNYTGMADYIDYYLMPTSFEKYVEMPTLYKEDFEDSSALEGWTFFDADNDGFGWEWDGTLKAHSGAGLLCSMSYDNDTYTPLTPDNWAFTPQISFTTDNYVSIWAIGQDANYSSEHFAVYIISDAPTADNLSSAVKLIEETTTGSYVRYSYKIPDEFANKTGYIGIRHFDCSDMFYLNIDDLAIVIGDPSAPAGAPAKNSIKHHVVSDRAFKMVEKGSPLTKASVEKTLPVKYNLKHQNYRNR